ncbi:uncharacterized protein LOC112053425 [Bicyclus anynana]|uniref:Uncharacterized protein LOC112053425 n=1 Tax=Bicyclus anynana TaxID=110368 RepID=A0A6J1NUY8_BICAN|nr:uncharacterized protein LOC112053425 [Bicyclus anynana]
MFESDDYDQVLSQLDFPELSEKLQSKNTDPILHSKESQANHRNLNEPSKGPATDLQTSNLVNSNLNKKKTKLHDKSPVSPTHLKRKMLNSYFDHKSKRKFPGPAGLLTGSFEEKKNDTICQMELLSQDVDFTQSYIHGDVFNTPLWKRLLEDTKTFNEINTIGGIKHQALVGNLQKKKAHIVTAFVENVDRSGDDPLITLRDKTGQIKCTLHRDAWSSFSSYIVAEYCALVIWKPTVLTTGSAFKKHYLNITLSNIWAIYSSAVIADGETLADGFQMTCEEDYTIIRMNRDASDINSSTGNESLQESFDDLDNVFLDDAF